MNLLLVLRKSQCDSRLTVGSAVELVELVEQVELAQQVEHVEVVASSEEEPV